MLDLPMFDWFCYIILAFFSLLGLGLAFLTLPGIWMIIFLAIVYAVLTDFAYIGWPSIVVIFVLGILAEVLEFVAGGAAATAAGGSRRSVVGAVLGGFIGAVVGTFIPVPIVGTLIGIVAGTFLGAAVAERSKGSSIEKIRDVAGAATKGRVIGMLLKLPFAVLILAWVLIAALPLPSRSAPTTQPTTQPATTPATLPAGKSAEPAPVATHQTAPPTTIPVVPATAPTTVP